jgi:hypothetical protein
MYNLGRCQLLDRRGILFTGVSCLAAGYAVRALVGLARGETDVDEEPWGDFEEEAVDPVLVPVRDDADPAAAREHAGVPVERRSVGRSW